MKITTPMTRSTGGKRPPRPPRVILPARLRRRITADLAAEMAGPDVHLRGYYFEAITAFGLEAVMAARTVRPFAARAR